MLQHQKSIKDENSINRSLFIYLHHLNTTFYVNVRWCHYYTASLKSAAFERFINATFQVIELELNKYYVKEADKKVEMINAFLPEHFTKRGGLFINFFFFLSKVQSEFDFQAVLNYFLCQYSGKHYSGSQSTEAIVGNNINLN